MTKYFRQLNLARFVLWCYLIWWLGVAIPYFDPNPRLWWNSLGIAGIIGTALLLSTAHADTNKIKLGRAAVARLYMMPFFVSSFGALIKDRGFNLVFHPSWEGNTPPLVACLAWGALVAFFKIRARRSRVPVAPAPSPGS